MQGTTSNIDYKELYEQQKHLYEGQLAVAADLSEQYEEQLIRLTELKEQHEQQLRLEADLREQVAAVTFELNQLRKMVFGSRRERFIPVPGMTKAELQLALDLDAETIAECRISSATKVEYIRTRVEVTAAKPNAHPGRMKLPNHLRRETIILKPDQDVSGLKKIGEDVTEILDYIPPELYVKQYIRPKYAAPLGDGYSTVITASLPGRMMEKCMAGEGLLAQMIVDKYVDHLPVHRQLQRYERMGVHIAQSTSNDWFRDTLNQLTCLYEAHKRQTLATGYLGADETPVKVLDESKKGTTHKGFYWVYHNSEQKLVLFDYRPGRGREGPDDILKDFQGYLQTDGYSAYEDFDKRPGIVLMHCMAHARRKFFDALQTDRDLAQHALELFGQLYAVERKIKEGGLSGDAIVAMRQQEAVPVLSALQAWMQEEYPKIQLKKSPIAQAMAYCLPRWKKLCIYTTDPRLQIDNNPVENAIRPVAIGRKNYLFAGSHEAAQRAAMIYSLLSTCKLHGINPYEWLKDVLQRMHLYTTAGIEGLLPQNWIKLPDWDMD
jgi:transposase